MLNIAYVGFGKSVNRYHLPYIKERLDRFRVKRIYARTLTKRQNEQVFWRTQGTAFTDQMDELLADQDLDLVVIVTPPATHYALAKRFLEHGHNVLLDKPMVATVNQAKDLLATAKAHDAFLMPFQNRLFDSDFLTLQKVLATGYVGRPIDLTVHMDHYRPQDAKAAVNAQAGDWYDHGVHLLDQMVHLFGRPNKMFYDIRSVRQLGPYENDHFQAQLFYPNAFKATVEATEAAVVAHPKWVLYGTKGTYIKENIDQQEYDLKAGIMPGDQGFGLDAPQDYGRLTYFNQNGDRLEKIIPTISGDYGRVYDAVYASLHEGKPKLVSDQEMLTVIELLEAGSKHPSPNQLNLTNLEEG